MRTTPARHVDHVENFTTTLENIKPSSALIVTIEADRDINAARNILLRFLTLSNIILKKASLGEASVSYIPYS